MNHNVIEFTNVIKVYPLQTERTAKELLLNLFSNLSKSRTLTIFNNLNFSIKNGETVGVIGKNGAGKSTIMKLIAGVTFPTKGKVVVQKKVAPLIELGAGFHHELTGYENIFLNAAILGMHKKEIDLVIEKIIEFSELQEFMDVPVKKYSTGMYMRLAFSIAVHTNADILIIDEVLAVGDDAFQKKCLNKLKEIKKDQQKTIIFVSHDEKAVKSFCDRAILLDKGKLVFDGDPDEAFTRYHKLSEPANPPQ
ncbi:MAG: hypothetical protein COY81_00325 [Candidatus Pacebacteria bacterium CG_4_10_14_0_8_um_filter_43_12]|nr:MAG: hypothetical protein COY81_00325 [Candidatus Pacebacteria bacterium CG_4_10_14_0_8_um_filter_43_12]